MKTLRFLALGALLLFTGVSAVSVAAKPVAAQAVDIIRGRVLGADTTPVQGVLVVATTLTGDNTRQSRTDKNGRYTITFPGGEGDYWVTFTALGFSPVRRQVKRTADQEILIADARMAAAAVNLAAFTVSERTAASRQDTVSDVGGTEKSLSTVDPALLTAEQMGDLAAMASAIPGVQLIPGADGAADAFSVLGLGSDQNNTQLNGLSFGDATVPRDAAVSATLSTSPYDVARGGFSGAGLQLRTRAGNNFPRRNFSSTLNTPAFQFPDRISTATASQTTAISIGGSASGPIRLDRLFYNTSAQFDRNTSDLNTLLNTSALGFTTSGIAIDSVSRLLNILNSQNVPITVGSYPGQNTNTRGSFLTSLDFNQANSNRGNTYSLAVSSNINSTQPARTGFGGGGSTILSTPSLSGTSLNWSLSTQGRHSGLVGFKGILTETNLGYSISEQTSDPYTVLPSGRVQVNSQLSDGSQSVRNLSFGGSTNLGGTTKNQTIGFSNTLSWFSASNRHRVKLTSELRREDNTQEIIQNQYGTFTFNSLEDLAAGRPASFSRLLGIRNRESRQAVGALSLGDAWRPTNDLQIQYGLRMDGNKYLIGPTENQDVTTAFGLSNTDVPSKIYFSPRVGFSWTYGTSNQLALVPGMVRAPRAVIRGGIGVFQNTPGTGLIGNAIDNTGLPTGIQQLTCVGDATPIPNWTSYQSSTNNIPTTCNDGTNGTVFASSTPNVLLFSPNYSAQRSLRANLSWSGAILKDLFAANADVTVSKNYAQSGQFDLNFPQGQQFGLALEGGRPVFVPTSVIVPSTGQIAWRDARTFTQFGRVTEQRSDLTSTSKQLTLGLRPVAFNSNFSWSMSYVLQDVREEQFGFASTVGDPTQTFFSPSNTSRHQVQLTLNRNFFNVVTMSMGMNFRSGRRYTPLINGDVNGDSYSNDRAFIFDPKQASTDPAVASGIQALLDNGTAEAADCLRSQLGKLASRNSCTTTWTASQNLSFAFNSLRIGLPQRARLRLQVSNPLVGLDRALHGEDKIHGWGQNPNLDQQLLYVRGFDPTNKTFKYEVNQRFGSTSAAQITNRAVFGLTAFLSFDLGVTRERYQLMQQLDRGRSRPGNKANAQQLRQTGNTGLINPMQQILVQSDSLKLTRKQADSLTVLNRLYVLKQDSIWAPVARELAALPDKFDRGEAFDKSIHARKAQVDLLLQIAPGIRNLLTAEQFRLLNPQTASFMDKNTLKALRSGTQGQGAGGMGGGGGGGGGGRGGN